MPSGVDIPASIAGDLGKIAKDLAGLGRAGAPKRTLAALVLRLSGEIRAAHEVLGHVEVDGAWYTPDDVSRRERGMDIVRALARARLLPVETKEVAATHSAYQQLYGQGGHGVKAHHVSIVGHQVDVARMHRIVRTSLRVLALANWFAKDELTVPSGQAGITFILCDTPEDYVRWVGMARDTGILDQDHYEIVKGWGFYWHQDFVVARPMPESAQLSTVVWCLWRKATKALYGALPQPCLGAGHVNWLCLSYYGAPMTRLLRVISHAGLVGTREWLRYLARKDEDPAWSHSMVADYVDVGGVDLLKSTVVAEFLQESGSFVDLVRKTLPQTGATDATVPPVMTEGLAELLDVPEGFDAKATGKWLAYLNGIRSAAADTDQERPADVELDHTLSEGARAGQNGVIVYGVDDAVEAIDWWMGTSYHRLPLLDPGMMRVGWGMDRKTAVLDVLSLRRPVQAHHVVVWPAQDAKQVPTRFKAGEKPHPVPGEDQSAWGYPITLQLYWQSDDPDVRMTLREGGASGDVVPCHYSTPRAPTNPEIAPHAAYCLIPKQHLRRKTTYTVTAEGIPAREPLTWSFQTGS